MPTVGFLYNFPEGAVSEHPFFLYRIAPMTAYFEPYGIRVFVYSPHHVDHDNGFALGFIRENGRFMRATLPVPAVNGNWHIGADKLITQGGMSRRTFWSWAIERGIEIYPNARFISQLRDKILTYKLITRIDPSLHPYTEPFKNDPQQLERFLARGQKAFLKPQVGNKGNQIIILSQRSDGLAADYYDQKNKTSMVFPEHSQALDKLRPLMAGTKYVIQDGVPLMSLYGSTFILRVIMLHDGERWDWFHKAVLAAPHSEVANTTQGGVNHPTETFLARVYGKDQVDTLIDEVRRICFETTHSLDQAFDNGVMEIGYDIVIDQSRRVHIVEINTRPGMTKPGLPNNPFRDIFNRTASENALYERYVHPHGTMLAKFLHTKMKARYRDQKPKLLSAIADGENPRLLTDDTLDLDSAIRNAAGYLASRCKEDGMFDYRVHPDPAIKIKPRYNILRHAGAIFSLCSYLDRNADPKAHAALQRAAVFLRDRCLFETTAPPSCHAIRSLPGLEVDPEHEVVKLGNVGLGLSAFVALEKHVPECLEPTQLHGLGRFLVEAQKPDGSFASNYLPTRGGFRDRPVSLFYPGEAALGLALLFDYDADVQWLEAALKVLAYLARSRRDQSNVPPDHWALIATAKVLGLNRDHAGIVAQKDLIHHAIQVCGSVLRDQVLDQNGSGRFGGFSPDGLTIPTAVGLKCLLTTLSFLPQEMSGLRERIVLALHYAIGFLLRAQVRDAEYQGGIRRAIGPLDAGHPEAKKFNRRADEIRIDYVQHALYAFIDYDHQFVTLPARASIETEH